MKKSTYKYATIFTVILCLATLAVAWTSSWFSNWNVADWSKKWETLFGIEQQEPKPDGGTDTPGGGDTPQTPVDNDVVAISGKGDKMVAGETYDVTNFAYVCAENSVNKTITLNATVYPEDSTDINNLSWKVEWVNPNVGFANGKKVNDYITIKEYSDTPTVCDVTYKQDFGSQIKVVAYISSNPSVKAECTVDCIPKIEWQSFTSDKSKPTNLFIDFNGKSFTKDTNGLFVLFTSNLSYTYNQDNFKINNFNEQIQNEVKNWKNKKLGFLYKTTIGTLTNDINSVDYTLTLTPEFIDFVNSQGWSSEVTTQTITMTEKCTDNLYEYSEPVTYKGIATSQTYNTMNDIYRKFVNVTSDIELKKLYDWVNTEGNYVFSENIVVHTQYEDLTFSNNNTLIVYVDIPATNIELDQGNIKV